MAEFRPFPAGWENKLLVYYDAETYYTKGPSSPRPVRAYSAPGQTHVRLVWTDGTDTSITQNEAWKIIRSVGATGVGLGMESWARPIVSTKPATTLDSGLTCMWCAERHSTLKELEEHEASHSG